MWSFFSVVVMCTTLVWLAERFPTLRERMRGAERVTTAGEEPISAPVSMEPMPAELLQVALMESESWAREAAIKSMYEMYEQCKDWRIVAAQWRPFDPNAMVS